MRKLSVPQPRRFALGEFVACATAGALAIAAGYAFVEPGVVSATSATDSVDVTLNVDAGISITSPSDASMSRNLGVSANTAIASTDWNVKTNNVAGYTLSVHATTSPAMHNGSSHINDYTPAVTDTPETWSVSNAAEFGFSSYGTDVDTGTWGTGSDCGSSHVPSATLKYTNFKTSDIQVATRSSTTTTSGIDSNVCYAVEQNSFYAPSGTYQATIVATAATL